MNIGLVWDRVNSVVATQGFRPALNPFDFERQPSGTLDLYFHLKTERTLTEGYLGGVQMEQHRISIHVARKIKRDPWGAARQLKADMDLIEEALANDWDYDYYVIDDVSSDLKEPNDQEDFVVGQLGLVVDFDRP